MKLFIEGILLTMVDSMTNYANAKKVADAFAELYEIENILVVDAGREDTVLSSYSIIDRHIVLKMQLPLRIVEACLKTCGRNGLTRSFFFWQKEHQWQKWDIMRYSGVCQRRNKRNL